MKRVTPVSLVYLCNIKVEKKEKKINKEEDIKNNHYAMSDDNGNR